MIFNSLAAVVFKEKEALLQTFNTLVNNFRHSKEKNVSSPQRKAGDVWKWNDAENMIQEKLSKINHRDIEVNHPFHSLGRDLHQEYAAASTITNLDTV